MIPPFRPLIRPADHQEYNASRFPGATAACAGLAPLPEEKDFHTRRNKANCGDRGKGVESAKPRNGRGFPFNRARSRQLRDNCRRDFHAVRARRARSSVRRSGGSPLTFIKLICPIKKKKKTKKQRRKSRKEKTETYDRSYWCAIRISKQRSSHNSCHRRPLIDERDSYRRRGVRLGFSLRNERNEGGR